MTKMNVRGLFRMVAVTAVLLLGVTVQAQEKKLRIGLSMPSQIVERFVRDKDFLVEEAHRRGHEVIVQIADEDPSKQNAQVENLLSQGIDVLIINPHDGESAATAVKEAKKAGIPVVSYVRLVLNSDVDAWVADDFFATGVLQGKYLASHVPKGNYVLLHGAREDYNSVLFYNGAMSVLQPLIKKGDIKVVLDQTAEAWKPSNAMAIVENALTKSNNHVDAVLSPNDGLAGGAIQALSAQGLAGKIPVTGGDAGLDAAKRIAAGTQAMTVYRDIKELAKIGITVAERLAKKQSIKDLTKSSTIDNKFKQVPTVFSPAVAVTRENLDDVLITSGYHKREAVYGK
jgi:D-xylose transport system substrate-binding protein